MKINSSNQISSILILFLLMASCQPNQEKAPTIEHIEPSAVASKPSEEEVEIKAVIDRILDAVGNGDAQELKDLSFEKAVLGWTYEKDGYWMHKEVTIEEYLARISETENPTPISETAIECNISVSKGRLANVNLPTVISKFGVASSQEINHVTMMKENDQWKLFSVAWTAQKIPEEERVFDMKLFARGYAQVWGSQKPGFVAAFFAEDGELTINNGSTAKGTGAITDIAKGFMDAFPDMKVSLDSLTTDTDKTQFHWTLTGTNNGINGNGNKVSISGYEEWTMNDDGLIQTSKGYYDEEEYKRQLEFGIAN
jgi:hypothetical protein